MPRFPPGGEEHRRGRATLAARAACTTGDGHGSISAAALCGTLGLPWVCDGDLIFPRGNSMKFTIWGICKGYFFYLLGKIEHILLRIILEARKHHGVMCKRGAMGTMAISPHHFDGFLMFLGWGFTNFFLGRLIDRTISGTINVTYKYLQEFNIPISMIPVALVFHTSNRLEPSNKGIV